MSWDLGNSNIGTIKKNMEKNLASVVKERESDEETPSKNVVIDHVRIEGAKVVISTKTDPGRRRAYPHPPTIDMEGPRQR